MKKTLLQVTFLLASVLFAVSFAPRVLRDAAAQNNLAPGAPGKDAH